MIKIDIQLIKNEECSFCPNAGAKLWGIKIILPDGKSVFLCECCLRTQIGKIQDRSYMNAVHQT